MLKILEKQNKTKAASHSWAYDGVEGGSKGQVILEFTFCMIIVLLMIYGVVKVFHWAGEDMVERRKAHDGTLRAATLPVHQIDPYFYTPVKMNAIWDGF